MKKFILSVAVVLGCLAFVSCDDTELIENDNQTNQTLAIEPEDVDLGNGNNDPDDEDEGIGK